MNINFQKMKRLFRSFGFAWKGIKSVFRTESNMKIHVSVAIFVVVMGFLLQISQSEWLAVIFCIGLVICSEMINTAFETLVDKVSPEKDPLAGKTKDIAAGAVLICAGISVVVGVIVFLPKLIKFLASLLY